MDGMDIHCSEVFAAHDGKGTVIALDRSGQFALPFNTEGMYRGWIRAGGEPHIEIYK